MKCLKTFTFRNGKPKVKRKFTDSFIKEAVVDFIQGRSSFAVIKERKGVSVGTISKWVNDFGKMCPTPVEIAIQFGIIKSNKYSGILLLDGKYLNKKDTLLLAVDYLTLDVVGYLVAEKETEANYSKLIDQVEACGYKVEVIISDGHQGVMALTRPKRRSFTPKATRRYPRPGITPSTKPKARLEGIPHQWCTVHAQRDLTTKLSRLNLGKEKSVKLKKLVSQILFAKTLPEAKRGLRKLVELTRNDPKTHKEITLWIWKRWRFLTLHYNLRIKGRKIPRSSNSVENVISYINTRLKTLRRLRNTISASNISNLIILNYRTKPLQNTKSKLKRGKSPLCLTTGKNKKTNWINLIKKSTA